MENKKNLGVLLGGVALCVGIYAAVSAYNTSKIIKEFQSDFSERVGSEMMEFIKQNPEHLMNAMGEGIAKKKEEAINRISNDIYASMADYEKGTLVFGKEDSKTVVYCLFDPMCSHCIEFQKSMVSILKKNKNACFKLIPIAALGEDSRKLTRIYFSAYALNKDKTVSLIEKIVNGEDVNKETLEKSMKDAGFVVSEISSRFSEVDKIIDQNGQVTEKLHVPTIPVTFVRNGDKHIILKGISSEDIEEAIEDASK